jgi:hypothetical protein
MSAQMTQSLRARNPSVRVTRSIYSREGDAGAALAPEVASIVAPSEREFDFDDLLVNSHVYRKVMHAQAKTNVATIQEPALGDLMDRNDTPSPREEDSLPAAPPSMSRDLQDSAFHAPAARERTSGCSEDQRTESATVIAEPGTDLARSRQFGNLDLRQPPRFAELLEQRGPNETSTESQAVLRCSLCTFT